MKKREIKEKINKLNKVSNNLNTLAKTGGISFEKSKNIYKQQNEAYKKFVFFKNIFKELKELEKEDSNEKNKS